MEITRINRPDKLIAAIIFLLISQSMHILNVGIILWNAQLHYSGMNALITFNFIVLNLAGSLWLTYLVFKGKNWARYYILVYIIVSVMPASFYNMYVNILSYPVLALHNGIHLAFVLISFYFLFSKNSSLWFKQLKQSVDRKLRVSNNFRISSICLYAAYIIAVLILMIDCYNGDFEKELFNSNYLAEMFFSADLLVMVITMMMKTGTVNILFIYSINKGSKLAGIIYLAAIVNSTFTFFLFLGYSPIPANPLFSLWSLRVTIQVIAFIVLFQKDVNLFFYKITHHRNN